MSTSRQFIRITKITERQDGSLELSPDNIPTEDITNFRKWNKKGKDETISGEFTQLSIKSLTAKGGFYNILIQEGEEEFGKRLGTVIPLPDATGNN